jgi:hypothetical protein
MFPVSDTLEIYAEAYTASKNNQRILSTISIQTRDGRSVLDQNLETSTPGAGVGGALCYPLRASLRLDRLSVGDYLFNVSASLGAATTDRSIPFSIR